MPGTSLTRHLLLLSLPEAVVISPGPLHAFCWPTHLCATQDLHLPGHRRKIDPTVPARIPIDLTHVALVKRARTSWTRSDGKHVHCGCPTRCTTSNKSCRCQLQVIPGLTEVFWGDRMQNLQMPWTCSFGLKTYCVGSFLRHSPCIPGKVVACKPIHASNRPLVGFAPEAS